MIFHSAWEGFKQGKTGLKSGLLFGGSLHGSLHSAWHSSYGGALPFALPMAAFGAGMAPRGTKVSSGLSSLTMGAGSFVGGLLGGTPGAIVGGLLGDEIASTFLGKQIQTLADSARNKHRIRQGGDYQDSAAAATMRQLASQEMSRSLLNSRQMLGQEGSFMHS